MVAPRTAWTVLPRHAPSLAAGDYLTCAAAWWPWRRPAAGLEALWAPWLGRRAFVPTGTGREALWRYLELAGLKAGDEVLVAAYNYYAIVRLLLQRGLVPVFVDIEPVTLCLDADDLARKMTGRARLVIVTHMFGHPADLARIRIVCRARQVPLFEDCAHAVGTYCGDAHVGAGSHGALFSFGIYKAINTFGGGLLVLPPSEAAAAAALPALPARRGLGGIADHAVRAAVSALLQPVPYTLVLSPFLRLAKRRWPSLYHLVDPSGDDPAYRFAPGQRAPFRTYMRRLMARQLPRVEGQVARRRAIIGRVKAALADLEAIEFLDEDRHGRANGAYFGFYVPDPEDLARALEAQGISSDPHEYYDCSQLAQFAEYARPCPQAQTAAAHLLRVPSFPHLRDGDVERLITALRSYFTAGPGRTQAWRAHAARAAAPWQPVAA